MNSNHEMKSKHEFNFVTDGHTGTGRRKKYRVIYVILPRKHNLAFFQGVVTHNMGVTYLQITTYEIPQEATI